MRAAWRHRAAGLCGVALLLASACRHVAPATRPPAAGRECPVNTRADERLRIGVSEADSSLTQSRVRWAIADLVAAVNSREVADLALRYDWAGDVRDRSEFLSRARGQVASTRLVLDSSGAWWSDAPGRKQQQICLTLSVQGSNGGGVSLTHRVALRAKMLDDGRAAWLSRLEVADLTR